MKEIWVDIKEYEGIYQISNTLKLRSLDRTVIYKNGRKHFHKGKLLKFKRNEFGYQVVSLCKDGIENNKSRHRLIAEAFIDNPNNYPFVLHLNDVPGDDRIENLKWGTQKHNIEMAVSKNRMSNGNNHYMNKILRSQKPTSRIICDLQTGIFYDSITDAAEAKGFKTKWLQDHLYKRNRIGKISRTSLIYA